MVTSFYKSFLSLSIFLPFFEFAKNIIPYHNVYQIAVVFHVSLVTEITGAVSAGYSRKIKEKNRSAFCSRSNLEKANSLDAPNLTALKTYLGLIYDIIGNGLSVSLLSNFSSPITGCLPPPHHSPVASQIS